MGLNHRPLPCEDSALPLSYAPAWVFPLRPLASGFGAFRRAPATLSRRAGTPLLPSGLPSGLDGCRRVCDDWGMAGAVRFSLGVIGAVLAGLGLVAAPALAADAIALRFEVYGLAG